MKHTNSDQPLRIWHPLIRLIHWWLVAAFTINYFVVDAGGQIHQWVGYGALAAVLLRIGWGFIDKGYGSFRTMRLSREALQQHFTHLKQRAVPKQSGHNPLGWLMVMAVIVLFVGLGVTGFMMEEIDALFGNSTLETVHAWLSNTLYGFALVHVAAVVWVSWRGRIALIRPMITGKRDRD
ncbi:cytochrome b/b6 domain-containing protein [Vibrio cyclitrophicus]